MTHIENAGEYVAAICERDWLIRLIQQGQSEFTGYGLELFERGINNRLGRVENAINEYETLIGYTTLAPNNFWIGIISAEMLSVNGGIEPSESAINSPYRATVAATENLYFSPTRYNSSGQAAFFPDPRYQKIEPSSLNPSTIRAVVYGEAA